jgi:LysM repeat protein
MRLGYNSAMKPVLYSMGMVALLCVLNSCQGPGTQAPNVGPFDSRGNYVEAWANDPSKWRPYTPKEVDGDPPRIAKNEQPPDHSIPLATGPAAPVTAVTSAPHRTTSGRVVASSPHRSTSERVVRGNTKPRGQSGVANTRSKSGSGSTAGRHTVKSGDSLSSIATSHGTTVAALKKANGLSGDMIRDGKSLVIPRRKR